MVTAFKKKPMCTVPVSLRIAYPVFVLPGALNSFAEETGRALANAVLRSSLEYGTVGPVFVIDGSGLLDMSETITDVMFGKGYLTPRAATEHVFTNTASMEGVTVIGEGLETTEGRAVPLFLEINTASVHEILPLLSLPSAGVGVVVKCDSFEVMATFMAQTRDCVSCFVFAIDEDEPLSKLVRALFAGDNDWCVMTQNLPAMLEKL